ncbi:YceI family protein [Roseimarinus sediminis]|uniref:YceI family protein n=1 Tax=Roseimarinus sediminis TaxID=1610899 RepID=UPI003D22774F
MRRIVSLSTLLLLVTFMVNAQTLKVDTSASSLKWNGKKVTGEHYGAIDLKSGSLTLKNDAITEGNFVIDMNSMTNEDLSGETRENLLGHLKSDDFFSVATHPEATLKIKSSTKFTNGKASVKGDLTIKGITHPIEFEAHKNGNIYTAKIEVDRTLYNVRYGSNKFFDNLGDKAIYDIFTLDVKLHTK